MTGEQLLTLSMDMGEKMIICGAEANRVEDTIRKNMPCIPAALRLMCYP